MATAAEESLAREVKTYLRGLEGFQSVVSGPVLQGLCLICGVFQKIPPAAGSLPAGLHKALEEGPPYLAVVEPLYKFNDSGASPLFSTFAELEELCKDRDILEVAIEYECRRSRVTREEVLKEAEFLVEVIDSALKKGEKEEIQLIGRLTDPDDGKKDAVLGSLRSDCRQ